MIVIAAGKQVGGGEPHIRKSAAIGAAPYRNFHRFNANRAVGFAGDLYDLGWGWIFSSML